MTDLKRKATDYRSHNLREMHYEHEAKVAQERAQKLAKPAPEPVVETYEPLPITRDSLMQLAELHKKLITATKQHGSTSVHVPGGLAALDEFVKCTREYEIMFNRLYAGVAE